MSVTQEEVRLVESLAAACKAFFYDPERKDLGRVREFCIELVRHGQCAVYTYPSDETRFWLELREEGRRGWCRYLDERPLLHGRTIEVWLGDRWVRARYSGEGLGDRAVTPDCILVLDTTPPSLIHLKHTEEIVIARWPRG